MSSTISEEEISKAKLEFNRSGLKFWVDRSARINLIPREDTRNILIASALPYVNNEPHLGNIIGCTLSADVFARFCRLRGANVLYVCGTDEYGTATENKAAEENMSPREICDKYHQVHSNVYKWFNIEFDEFGRTSTEIQTRIVQEIFKKTYENGFILEEEIEQLFCENCQKFLADRFVEGVCPFCDYEDARGDQCDRCSKLINAIELKNPRCKTCSKSPVKRTSKHLFLDLPKIQPKLEKWLESKLSVENNWSQTAKVITNSWLKEGLKARCITRDLKWGIPVPLEGYKDKVFYVWFDAPIGYVSITASICPDWEKWWKNPENVELYHFLGKDNVAFHSIIFPSTQLASNDKWTMCTNISATEYLNYEDSKFSKSRGTGVFGESAKNTGIPADIWRFYLLYIRPENQDTNFDWDDFMAKNNSELLNNLGNYINRTLSFLSNSFDSTVGHIQLNDDDFKLLAKINRELQYYIDLMENLKLRDGIKAILNISRLGNQYLQSEKPWKLIKDEATKNRAISVISLSTNLCLLLSILIEPYMPETSKQIQSQIDYKCNVLPKNNNFTRILPENHKINKPEIIFKQITIDQIKKFREQFGSDPKKEMESKLKNELRSKSLSEIEALISQQGDKIRKMKTDKKIDKKIIKDEVQILLILKSIHSTKASVNEMNHT
ncbi:Methionine--tRNA ligase [Sarcoptes scabiei]|uniref:Methionine--tRNA ligase, cytoplasmic n=1 Tax=Sarcoptes scabiei TaxID=52283 RepID=A0A834VFC3_SARSC|nr:Methionine--tRNA ligase [Sarcoptes scabiei]